MRAGSFAALVLILVLSLVLSGCTAEEESKPTEAIPTRPPVTATPQPEKPLLGITASSEAKKGLKLELSVPKVDYRTGEILKATLSLVNVTDDPISFSTGTSQLFDVVMKGLGLEREMRWSEDKMFTQVVTPRNVLANEALSEVLPCKVGLQPGDGFLVGLTVPFILDGEQVSFQTPPVKIKVMEN
jgi:hypothetical protein